MLKKEIPTHTSEILTFEQHFRKSLAEMLTDREWKIYGKAMEHLAKKDKLDIDSDYGKLHTRYDELLRTLIPIVLPMREKGYSRSKVLKRFRKKKLTVVYSLNEVLRLLYSYDTIRSTLKAVLNATKPKKEKPKPKGRKPKRKYPIKKLRVMNERGMSLREIAEKTGISKSTVHRLLSQNTK